MVQKKKLFCERLSANDMSFVIGGDATGSKNGTTVGGASSGGTAGYQYCVCVCGCSTGGGGATTNSPCKPIT